MTVYRHDIAVGATRTLRILLQTQRWNTTTQEWDDWTDTAINTARLRVYEQGGADILADCDLDSHADGMVSGAEAAFQMTPANGCTAAQRNIVVTFLLNYTVGGATDAEEVAWNVHVVSHTWDG